MFKFIFSRKKTITRDTTSYPITLATVKDKSFYFADNPDDTSLDDYINNIVIPNVILNWEKTTKYLLLDQSLYAYVPNLQYINKPNLEIELDSLNVRDLADLTYYPEDWNESDAKSILSTDEYLATAEIDTSPRKIRLKKDYAPLIIFPITNNLQIEYTAGFLDNDFTDLNQEIIDALSMQAAMVLDIKQGYCEDFYSPIISQAYDDYSLDRQLISFI